MAYFDPVNTQFTQPFDQGPETPSIDAGVDTLGLTYDPRTGTFSRTQGGGGGGSFGGGGSELPSRRVPGPLHETVPNTGGMGSQGVSGGVPPGGFAPNGGTNGDSVPGGAGALGELRKLFTDPSNLAGLASIIAALASGNGGGADSEEARRIQQITEARMRRVDPLHQAVTQLAWGRLPINARAGVTAPQPLPLPE